MNATVGLARGASSPPLLRLLDVTRTYRTGSVVVPALRGVSLELRAGEFVALVGPSGSGKSTLLHVCGLIDAPDGGTCALDGEETGALSERALSRLRRERIGFVFQGFNLVPALPGDPDHLRLKGVPLAPR